MKKPKVIAIVGMPGAGKGIVSRAAPSHGVPVLVCGDVIREETARRGLDQTPENMGEIMLEIRQKEGPAVVADRLVPKIESSKAMVVIVEGVRSMAEVEALRKKRAVVILGVHASPRTRYERLRARARSDDPRDWEEFLERDSRELSVGIGNVIAVADEMLVNETSVEDLTAQSERILAEAVHE